MVSLAQRLRLCGVCAARRFVFYIKRQNSLILGTFNFSSF